MGFLKRIFWAGSRCSECHTPLVPVKSGKLFKRGWSPCTVRQCIVCGGLTCGSCDMFGFSMMGGCKCGGHEFNMSQMWAMD